MEESIPKPWKYKDKWLVWPNTVFDFIEISDCADTIDGVCIYNKNLEECIEKSIEDSGCGYYIKFNDGRSICVPVRTFIHSHINPVYRLKNQNIYPELNNVSVFTFINTDKYSFPPNIANVIFYNDILQIKNIESGLFIDTDTSPKDGQNIKFGNINPLNIQFLKSKQSLVQISNLDPVKYGDYIIIIVPGTSLTLRSKVGENQMYWISNELSKTDFLFQIMPINNSDKIGDFVTYNSHFNIIYTNFSILFVGNNYELNSKYANFENEKNHFTTFSAISKMIGYYCDNKNCKEVPISEININGKSGTYKGSNVVRAKGCLGMCNYSISEINNIYNLNSNRSYINILLIIIVIIVIIVIIIINFYFKKKYL